MTKAVCRRFLSGARLGLAVFSLCELALGLLDVYKRQHQSSGFAQEIVGVSKGLASHRIEYEIDAAVFANDGANLGGDVLGRVERMLTAALA